ncbi:lycopene cyclase domain-containing protein [Mycobacterium sp. OAS707]|uniref:lycopene cyclase domain-containing protein n=1 Tax=Mycobacterium sp. OAS707 TaxID=2663822 RepID=UPI001788FB05|nr:lycopene cyclase domain-containing protein [Mycobacterium sp. OAS707]MBE1552515.1 lycopene cyclase domain-containing protein [Mycobacterium sp. OAS707]
MGHWQYLFVLAACLAITLPLELLGPGVYRQPWRTVCAIIPVAAVFVIWDAVAIAAGVWTYNPLYVTGVELLGRIPIEELLFFVVIPLCGLLTYNAVEALLKRLRRNRSEAARVS